LAVDEEPLLPLLALLPEIDDDPTVEELLTGNK